MANKQPGDASSVWNERYSVPEFIFGREPNAYLGANRENGKNRALSSMTGT